MINYRHKKFCSTGSEEVYVKICDPGCVFTKHFTKNL